MDTVDQVISEASRLTVLDHVPPGLLDVPAHQLHTVLPGPTVIHLEGRRADVLALSALQHGNEDVGLLVLQRLLKKHGGPGLPRGLVIFIGNVAAAKERLRRLDSQADFNRVWRLPEWIAAEGPVTAEHHLMDQVVAEFRKRRLFAAIDLHNNTGHNPFYACVTEMRNQDLHLASLFGRTAVFFRVPKGVQTMALAQLCPSVTCECGRVGDQAGLHRAVEFVDACLHMEELPTHGVRRGDLHLFHTVVTMRVSHDARFFFGDPPARNEGLDEALRFRPDFDWFNFRELEAGTIFANAGEHWREHLTVIDDAGRDRAAEFFEYSGGELRLRKTVMPSMLTLDQRVIRQDCLGYLMERVELTE